MDFVTDEAPRSSSFTPQRSKSKTSVELDIQVEEGELRAKYQQAVQSHFQRDLSQACTQYDALLKSDLLRPQVLLAAVQQMRDAYEEGVASTRSRLTLRYLTLKNRGKIEEEIVEERSRSTVSDATIVAPSSQPLSQSQSPSPTPPLSASTSSATLVNSASIHRALQFYISSMDMASALATLQANLEQGEHMDQDPSADAMVPSTGGGESGPSSGGAANSHRSEILVEDVSLWQSIARTAGKCHQYPLARHALEQAFKLQPDNMQIVDKLVDLLYVCSDYFMLWSLLQHGIKHLQTGGGETVTLTTSTSPQPTSVSLTLKFQVMQLQLLSWNIPDEQTKLNQEFDVLRDRLYGSAQRKKQAEPSKQGKSVLLIEQHLQEIKSDYAKHAAEANKPCIQRTAAPTSVVTVE